MLLPDGEHSAGFLNDLGVRIEDINFVEGNIVKVVINIILETLNISKTTELRRGCTQQTIEQK